MILQHSASLTVSDNDDIKELSPSDYVFRSSYAVSKNTSLVGDSAYLYLNANETKSVAIPLGYSSANRLRMIMQVNGVVEINITHPVLGLQTAIAKNGSFCLSMRVDAISCTEKAGSASSVKWSMMEISDANSEDFQ